IRKENGLNVSTAIVTKIEYGFSSLFADASYTAFFTATPPLKLEIVIDAGNGTPSTVGNVIHFPLEWLENGSNSTALSIKIKLEDHIILLGLTSMRLLPQSQRMAFAAKASSAKIS
ncbi:hypothetical protein LQZ19_06980, partial [Treponema primitia]|uniref:hypothetical protein n=1 Tax=Treponema primitia TaxID=88058 RepID=UPI003980CAF3